MTEIEKNIPLPPGGSGSPKGSFSSVLRLMGVGDSVLVPARIAHPASIAKYVSLGTGYKFTTRKTEQGMRIWRIE